MPRRQANPARNQPAGGERARDDDEEQDEGGERGAAEKAHARTAVHVAQPCRGGQGSPAGHHGGPPCLKE